VCALLAVLSLLIGLSNTISPRPLETHEVYVAQSAREMLQRADWVLPTFNHQPRLNKPPLAYWLVMALEKLAPSNPPVPEWKARLPAACAGSVLVVVTALVGRALYTPALGLLAGLIVCACSGLFRYANTARPEMLYAACCSLVVLGWVRSLLREGGGGALAWALLGWLGFGLAVLAKGPHIPALMLLGVLVHLIKERGLRAPWRALRPHWGLALMLAVALPWIIAVTARASNAGTVWFDQLSDAADRTARGWGSYFAPYYLWGLPQIMLPAVALLPLGVASVFVKGRPDLARGRVLMWMFAAVLVALSLTTHRRSYYMLPALPLLAPLMAAGTADLIAKLSPLARRAATTALIAALLLSAAVFIAIGPIRAVWGEGGFKKDEFARAVAAAAGPDEPVILYGEQAGLVTYRLNRETPEARNEQEVAQFMSGRLVLVVTTPILQEKLTGWFDVVKLSELDTGQQEERRVLVRLVPWKE